MGTFIIVIIAIIITVVVSIIAIPVFMFLNIAMLGAIFPNKTMKRPIIHLLQMITYALAEFTALMMGAFFLNKFNAINLLPVLFIVVVLLTLKYASTSFSFKTEEAEKLNKNQKTMNIIATVIAVVAVKVITSSW